jgi:hypothetical protein
VQFSQGQRELAIRAMDEAEHRTARYYCIPPHRWQDMPYDLLTRQDQEWEPLPDAALARVQLFQRLNRRRGLHAFYRIQLNDPVILLAAERDNLDSHLYPFLVYILTHEMVHLVRLTAILDNQAVLPPFDASEELRVQRISNQILTGPAEFLPVLEKFGSQPAVLRHE